MPLVSASNDANATDRYQWDDITGEQYHYPNGYKNLIRSGEPFVYYRGIRRADGTGGPAEYFGRGVVGSIWPDPANDPAHPKNTWAWYCRIDGFVPFTPPIAKTGGVFFEAIRKTNGVTAFARLTRQHLIASWQRPEVSRWR